MTQGGEVRSCSMQQETRTCSNDYWRTTVTKKFERPVAQITLVRMLSKFSSTDFCPERLLSQIDVGLGLG